MPRLVNFKMRKIEKLLWRELLLMFEAPEVLEGFEEAFILLQAIELAHTPSNYVEVPMRGNLLKFVVGWCCEGLQQKEFTGKVRGGASVADLQLRRAFSSFTLTIVLAVKGNLIREEQGLYFHGGFEVPLWLVELVRSTP